MCLLVDLNPFFQKALPLFIGFLITLMHDYACVHYGKSGAMLIQKRCHLFEFNGLSDRV